MKVGSFTLPTHLVYICLQQAMNALSVLANTNLSTESDTYSSPCRCSGEYIISVNELELGVDTVACSTCSLIVRIHYEVSEDSEVN